MKRFRLSAAHRDTASATTHRSEHVAHTSTVAMSEQTSLALPQTSEFNPRLVPLYYFSIWQRANLSKFLTQPGQFRTIFVRLVGQLDIVGV